MLTRELLTEIGLSAKGKIAFEELDVLSVDEDWVEARRAAAATDEVSRTLVRFLDDTYLAAVVPWCAAWVEHGSPRIAVGPRLAASLMATTMTPESAAHAKLPWDAVLLQVPEGLLAGTNAEGAREAMRFVLAWSFPSGEVGVRVLADSRAVWAIRSAKLEAFAEPDDATAALFPELDTAEKRSLLLVRRLVLGVSAGLESSKAGGAQPDSRVASVGLQRELKIDCRDAIRSYVDGATPAAPSHGLARGHWKKLAEWSWIQPYWGDTSTSPTSVRMRVLRTER